MKRIVAGIFVLFVLVVVAFYLGGNAGAYASTGVRAKHDLQLHKQLVELDRSFFTNVVTRPSVMTSGHYVLEIRYASKTNEVSDVELEVSNGRLVKGSGLSGFTQNANVVSWEWIGADESPGSSFVGVVDGNGMWGRVYVRPGQGWRQGESPNYGVWRLYQKSDR